MRFKKFDRVSYEYYGVTYLATFVDYLQDDYSCLIVLDTKKFEKDNNIITHNGLNTQLKNLGNTITLNLPNRCRLVETENLTLLYSLNDEVEFEAYDRKTIGTYVVPANGLQETKILMRCKVGGHDGTLVSSQSLTGETLSNMLPAIRDGYLWHEGNLSIIRKLDESEIGKMRYIPTKKISGENIEKHHPCHNQFNKFVKEYGFYNEIEWSKEIEDKFEEENGWIEFLVDNDFLDVYSITNIELDINKVYCFKWNYSIYKICKLNNKYNMCCINDTYHNIDDIDCSWDEIIKRHDHYKEAYNAGDLKVFNSIKEAINYFI